MGQPNIENFIPDRNINLLGDSTCDVNFGSLSNITLQESGRSQVDKVNFDNTITLYTDNITNDIKTLATAYTNGLLNYDDYQNSYETEKYKGKVKLLLQITKLSNNDNSKIKETYLQAYYTNEVKLKIRFSKTLLPKLLFGIYEFTFYHFGNDKEIILNVSNPNVLGIRNKSTNPVKITFKPR